MTHMHFVNCKAVQKLFFEIELHMIFVTINVAFQHWAIVRGRLQIILWSSISGLVTLSMYLCVRGIMNEKQRQR